MRLTLVRMHFQAGQTKIEQFSPGPAAIGRYSGKDQQIRRLNGAMDLVMGACCHERIHNLKADAQNCVGRHRAMRVNPGLCGFTFQIFGYKNQVIMLDSDVKNSGDVTVIELLRRPRAVFESDAFHLINTGEGNELHRHRSTAVVTDRFISNDGALALDLARRSIVVQTDRIVF